MVVIGGEAWWLGTDVLRKELERDPDLQRALAYYSYLLIAEITQGEGGPAGAPP